MKGGKGNGQRGLIGMEVTTRLDWTLLKRLEYYRNWEFIKKNKKEQLLFTVFFLFTAHTMRDCHVRKQLALLGSSRRTVIFNSLI